jgi:DnaJ-class molecular chaperone
VKVEIAPSKIFRRKGSDVFVDCRVSLTKALLGGTIRVPTLTGEVEVKVPQGTQPGDTQRMRGKGIIDPRTREMGHQFITFNIQIPKSASLHLLANKKEHPRHWQRQRAHPFSLPLSLTPPPFNTMLLLLIIKYVFRAPWTHFWPSSPSLCPPFQGA